MPTPTIKYYLFIRRLPPLPKGEWGGLEKLMFDWFERVDYRTNHVTVAVTTGWKERFLVEAQKRNITIDILELPFVVSDGALKRFSTIWNISKEIKFNGIVYFQAYYSEFSVLELLAGWFKAKGNIYMHENLGAPQPEERPSKRYFGVLPAIGLWWYYQRWIITARSWIATILVVSQEIKNRYLSWWNYVPSRVLVTYHGVDTQQFTPDPKIRATIRQQLNIKPNDIVLMTTARFTQQKCLDRAISAFAASSKDHANLILLMAGNGPLENDLRKLSASFPCREQIKFLGLLKDPADYLKASDVFVLSSDNEGLSLALLEAMASGLICLSTNCTGSNEAIATEKTGFIVEKSTEGVTHGLKRILSLSETEKMNITQAAIQFVRTNFEINTNVQKVFKTIGLVN